jgi:hypothetical protein
MLVWHANSPPNPRQVDASGARYHDDGAAWPSPLYPQQAIVPSVRRAHQCAAPPAIAVKVPEARIGSS